MANEKVTAKDWLLAAWVVFRVVLFGSILGLLFLLDNLVVKRLKKAWQGIFSRQAVA
jgi:hypothetical protein